MKILYLNENYNSIETIKLQLNILTEMKYVSICIISKKTKT